MTGSFAPNEIQLIFSQEIDKVRQDSKQQIAQLHQSYKAELKKIKKEMQKSR
jgi:hypothetical protein